MAGAGDECFARVGADEAVAADGLGCCSGFEEERELGAGKKIKLWDARICTVLRLTYFAATLRYMLEGVRNSDETEAQRGMRLGALGNFLPASTILLTSSSDGRTATYKIHNQTVV